MSISSKNYVKDGSGFSTQQGDEPSYYPLRARFGLEFCDERYEALYQGWYSSGMEWKVLSHVFRDDEDDVPGYG